MKDRRADRERSRSEPRWAGGEKADRLVEEKAVDVRLECSFDVAHLTWMRCADDAVEPVELGQASEPMS